MNRNLQLAISRLHEARSEWHAREREECHQQPGVEPKWKIAVPGCDFVKSRHLHNGLQRSATVSFSKGQLDALLSALTKQPSG